MAQKNMTGMAQITVKTEHWRNASPRKVKIWRSNGTEY